MQDPWSLVTMLLLAVLVGASLPVLLQLFSTLGSMRRTLERLGPKLDAALTDVRETTRRLNGATAGLDVSVQRARKLLDATGDLGESMQRLNRSLKPAVALGAALGPAMAVAIKSLVDRYCVPDAEGNPGGGQAQVGSEEGPGESTPQGDA